MFKKSKYLVIAMCLLAVLMLCGCTKQLELSAGKFPEDSVEISAIVQPGDLALMDGFYQLNSADFSGSRCYDDIVAWANAHPNINVKYSVALPDGQEVSFDVKKLDLSSMDSGNLEETKALFSYMPAVEEIKLPDGISIEELEAVLAACPDAKLKFNAVVGGINIGDDTNKLDLRHITSADLDELMCWLPYISSVEEIELGEEDGRLTWDNVSAIAAACPDAVMNYSFELYGKSFKLTDTEMNLYRIPIDDEGALVKQVTACMKNLEYLDMDSCGVSSEAMAEIRDSLPDTKVVWRVWFGERYSVRTDVEKILASNPGMGGELLRENVGELKYCTEVKYLDVGHNNYLNDVSFVGYMPKLEVAILAMDCWNDISGLANCPNLEYLEIQTSPLNDLRPLAELKNLKHLNISFCMALTDMTPIYNLTQLERLWISKYTPIPKEQVEEFRRLAPECIVNDTVLDPTEGGWRRSPGEFGFNVDHPRYKLLTEQFGYAKGNEAYAYYYNDPLCPSPK